MGNVYKYNRRSIRLKHYDYSQAGYYFITICTQGRVHLFGEIVDGVMVLNDAGKMIHMLWYEITDDFPNVYLHEFVIMPNHIHGIIEIVDNENISKPVGVPLVGTLPTHVNTQKLMDNHNVKGNHKGLPLRENDTSKIKTTFTVGDVIGAFKSKSTNQYIKMVNNGTCQPFNKRIWQRNYHEHVIRDDVDYERVATYTINNPLTWEDDILSKS